LKFVIPKHDQQLVLTKPWKFNLNFESKSSTLWAKLLDRPRLTYKDFHGSYDGIGRYAFHPPQNVPEPRDMVLPKGTVIQVETYHMLRGHTQRMVFKIRSCPNKKLEKTKFCVSAEDCGKMYYKFPEPVAIPA
jgi:hypothetical protein